MVANEPRAGKQPPRPKTDAVLRGFGRFVLSAFFREIEVLGEDRFPTKGPVIVVANHFNSLIDGVLVTCYLPRIPRLLAASIIWGHKPLRPLLNAAGVIPFFRQRDVGLKVARGQNTLAVTWDLLRAGGVLALFPEGISQDQPFLMPLKSGAARIALDSEELHGPLGVTIIPVGLVFDSKTRFRSRALVQIGEPVEFASIAQAYERGDSAARRVAIKEITQRIETGLSALTQNFDSWEDARLVGRAADIWGQQEPDLPAKLSLGETFKRRRAFGRGFAWMTRYHPKETASLRNTLIEYDDLLMTAGLRDEQVGATYPPLSALGFVGYSLVALIVRLPLSIVGTVLNWIPYQVSRVFAQGKDRDKMATWSIFSSLILFPVLWLLQAVIAGMIAARWYDQPWGWLAFFFVLLAAPLTGRTTLAFHDRRRRLFHEARAWLVLRTHKKLARQLEAKRREILDQLAKMVALYDREAN